MNIFAGDLGGSKTLLAIYELNIDSSLRKLFQRLYSSKEWIRPELMLDDFVKSIPKNIKYPTFGCLAVAGPIKNGDTNLTNLGWELNEIEICKHLHKIYGNPWTSIGINGNL